MDRVECVVVGAGVVGLAIARRLAQAGREVIVLEATGGIGNGTSSRNSEVIHAGIYYPTGSLMARTCVSGKHALYEYCESHGVPHKRCGKLIVATTPEESTKLAAIKAQAAANGVADLEQLDRAQVKAMEPALTADTAHSASSRPTSSSSNHSRCMPCTGGWCMADSIHGTDHASSRTKAINRRSHSRFSRHGRTIKAATTSSTVPSNANTMTVLVG